MDLQHAYCYFLDDDTFRETDRPGFRRRVVTGEHLQLCFWRIAGGATGIVPAPPRRNEQLGIVMRGRARLPDRRRPGRRRARRARRRRGRTSRPGTSGTATGLHRRRRVRRVLDPRRLRPAARRPRARRADRDRHATGDSPSTSAARSPTSCCSTRAIGHGRGRQDAHHAGAPARRRAHAASAQLLGQGRRAPGRHHGADRARHDADHQRADRGQDRPRRRS